jgi:hypothetical protein
MQQSKKVICWNNGQKAGQKMTWIEILRKDLIARSVTKDMALDRTRLCERINITNPT